MVIYRPITRTFLSSPHQPMAETSGRNARNPSPPRHLHLTTSTQGGTGRSSTPTWRAGKTTGVVMDNCTPNTGRGRSGECRYLQRRRWALKRSIPHYSGGMQCVHRDARVCEISRCWVLVVSTRRISGPIPQTKGRYGSVQPCGPYLNTMGLSSARLGGESVRSGDVVLHVDAFR